MRQIYHFEREASPALNENMLQSILEKRRLRWISAALALASVLLLVAVLMLAIWVYSLSPVLSYACMLYACAACAGAAILSIFYAQQRRVL